MRNTFLQQKLNSIQALAHTTSRLTALLAHAGFGESLSSSRAVASSGYDSPAASMDIDQECRSTTSNVLSTRRPLHLMQVATAGLHHSGVGVTTHLTTHSEAPSPIDEGLGDEFNEENITHD